MRRARIATRRLREALQVVARVDEAPRVDLVLKTLRTIGRQLGPVRDIAVARDQLRAAAENDPTAAEIAIVLEQTGRRTLARFARAADRLDVAPLAARLDAIARGVRTAQGSSAWTRVLATRLAHRTAAAREALDHLTPLYDPERLHEVRVAIKKLRYALELGAAAGLVPATLATRLIRHQKRFGAWHDRVALIEIVRALEAHAPSDSLPAWSHFLRARDREARRLHGVLRRNHGSLECCLADVRAATAAAAAPGGRRVAKAGLARRARTMAAPRRSG